MTAIDHGGGAGSAAVLSTVARVARRLGWTEGQVWTVFVGLTLALPASLFGLGPTQLDRAVDGAPFAAPPAARVEQAPTAVATPSPLPAILSPPSNTAAGAAPPTARDEPQSAASTPPPPPGDEPQPFAATIDGPGRVRAVAVAADAVAVAVDGRDGSSGRLVVVDPTGAVVSSHELRVGDTDFEHPNGVAVTEGAVLVSTTTPPAVLRVDPIAGTITKLAEIPDVPLCVPIAVASDCQPLGPDRPPQPRHLSVTEDDVVYVTDAAQACLFRIGGGEATASTWLCDALFSASPAAPGGGLAGVAAIRDRVVFTIASGLDGADGVYEVQLDGDAAGERRQIGRPPHGAGSGGLVLLPDGRVVVALTDAGSLLVVEADGSGQRVVELGDGLDQPVDLDISGDDVVILHGLEGSAGGLGSRSVDQL